MTWRLHKTLWLMTGWLRLRQRCKLAPMANFTITAGSGEFAEIVLQYGPNWSGEEDDGDPVLRADTQKVLFIVKQKENDQEYVMQLSDDAEDQIFWEDVNTGQTSVFVGAHATNKMAQANLFWEMKVQMTDDRWFSAATGKLTIKRTLETDGSC